MSVNDDQKPLLNARENDPSTIVQPPEAAVPIDPKSDSQSRWKRANNMPPRGGNCCRTSGPFSDDEHNHRLTVVRSFYEK